jgi:hypothetical protein
MYSFETSQLASPELRNHQAGAALGKTWISHFTSFSFGISNPPVTVSSEDSYQKSHS